MFGAEFTGRLETLVDREVAKLAAKLERSHKRRAEQRGTKPANKALQPTSRAGQAGRSKRPRRAARG
jgi:hypothetical protein